MPGRNRVPLFGVMAFVLIAYGCSGNTSGPDDEPSAGTGTVEVALVRSQGTPVLLFSVSVQVGADSTARLIEGEVREFSGLTAGNHVVEASDPTANCVIQGQNPRTVSVVSNQVTPVTFEVGCTFDSQPRIVFQWRKADSTVDIWTIHPDGSDPQQITSDGSGKKPRWSPDGTRIAFVGQGARIKVTNFDGTEEREVSEFAGSYVTWSPDGTRIAFNAVRQGHSSIMVAQADGSNPLTLTNDPASDWSPAWSNNGGKIAFCRDPGLLMVMNSDGTQPVSLSEIEGCSQPSWAPDDQKIVFSTTGEGRIGNIWRIGADGSDRSELEEIQGGCGGPVYLRDGSAITFHCPETPPDPVERAWIMDKDGGNQRLFAPIPWLGVGNWSWWEP